jgi:hypothetical protein
VPFRVELPVQREKRGVPIWLKSANVSLVQLSRKSWVRLDFLGCHKIYFKKKGLKREKAEEVGYQASACFI